MDTQYKTMAVRLEKEELAKFKQIALNKDTTMSNLVREFIKNEIEKEGL